jgi:hypothetical protein
VRPEQPIQHVWIPQGTKTDEYNYE